MAAVLVALCLSCASKPPRTEETAVKPVDIPKVTRNFDPLALTEDTIPVSRQLVGPEAKYGLFVPQRSLLDGLNGGSGSARTDSLGRQVFRVQLLMLETYSDARHALAVAEEIFDQPVSLVYEVPYYKIRVGEFGTRREADAYQQKTRLAGYANSWVMLSAANIRQIQPMYDLRDSLAVDTVRHGQ